MLTYQDCVGMCELTEDEIRAIAEHEHLPELVALELVITSAIACVMDLDPAQVPPAANLAVGNCHVGDVPSIGSQPY